MSWSKLFSCLLISTIACQGYGTAPPSRGNSVLVIGDTPAVKDTHSLIIKALKSAGRAVTFKSGESKTLPLESDGEYLYDGVVLLAPRSGLQSKLPVSQLITFVDSGRDLFVATSSGYSSFSHKVAEALGIDLDSRDNEMVDFQHTVNDLGTKNQSFIRAGGWATTPFAKEKTASDASAVVFRGAGATLFKDNELVQPLIWGSGSSFGRPASRTRTPLSKVPRVAGSGSLLAAAVCTRAGSRGTWFGSIDALSDEIMQTAGGGHAEAMKRLVQWAVSDTGVLRVTRVAHGRVADGGAKGEGGPADYRVKDVIEFMIQVEIWDGNSGKWVGFQTDDIQVEFIMMNPWVRTRLHLTNASLGIYKAKIQVPDQIGVYKFKVEYVRRGVSPIFLEKVIPVRPYLHNEYERFIHMASPYYASAFSMLAGVFLMGLALLYGGDDGWADANGIREKDD